MNTSTEISLQMFDHLSTAVLLFGEDLKLDCINAACEDLLSISNRQVMGHTAYEVLPRSTNFADIIKRSLCTGHAYAERCLKLDLHNSHSITVDCKVTPIMEGDVTTKVIVEMVNADPMQRALHEENIAVLHDAARGSVRGMAHEIKNPLGGIRGAAQLLERELDDEELIEYTQIIIQESDRLRNFIDSMLSSDKKLTFEKINIHEVLEYVCNLINAEFDQVLNIRRDYDPSLPDLYIDREQILQAVINVVRNAVQAIDVEGQILICTRALRKFTIHQNLHRLVLKIDIVDDGPGIPDEIENGIFYPMISGRAEGTGLGLSIAQSLINLHNGIIKNERKDEKTIFSIYLPMILNND